jgi:hypothetical protein
VTRRCELHPARDEHDAKSPAVLILGDSRQIPIDQSCRNAELIADGHIVDWSELEVRS